MLKKKKIKTPKKHVPLPRGEKWSFYVTWFIIEHFIKFIILVIVLFAGIGFILKFSMADGEYRFDPVKLKTLEMKKNK